MREFFRITVFTALITYSTAALSEPNISVGVGTIAVFDDIYEPTVSVSYQSAPLENWGDIQLTVLALLTEGNGYYVGPGLIKQFEINPDWSCAVGVSGGLAHESDASDALSYDINFYSRILFTYQIDVDNAVALELGHISNGGLDHENPGTEPLVLRWYIDF